METKNIIKIWKEIIYIAWYYKNYNLEDKPKIEKKLLYYKNKLSWSENIYAKKLITFVDDLYLDIIKNRELQIDNIFEDDFVWNYYRASKQVNFYNNLIDNEIYKKIIENSNTKSNNILLLNFYNNFKKNFLNLNIEEISYLLLIFTNFDIISPKKFLKRLYIFKRKYNFSQDSINLIKDMIKSYEKFLSNLYQKSLENFKRKNIWYKYIKISKYWEEKDFNLKFILSDSSFENFRTWNYLFEYLEIVKNLKK